MLNLFFALAILTAATPKPATNLVCPVSGSKVDAKSPKVVVRDQEYRVCCAACEAPLKADPDKFLNKDGSLKKAK